ncbi:hypothetical protein Rsub_12743 [Raphidocelis subcapitata]|uniref:Uncharacterized protein n=1 Tax=Raphidocelis subcapitata TaxID=307507 RepID=A0A2V0PK02_9CHLO|nr:hypothetical protein Rsub_12743 [Raphidocelis subcapitata]|eukprot:GBG00132.1 hypothetical protein Rsub_12743 [Raphidocelis subcapitata]
MRRGDAGAAAPVQRSRVGGARTHAGVLGGYRQCAPAAAAAAAMAIPAGLNRVLDVAHKTTVAVLAVSAVYFSVEIFRASWSIQEAKFEARQQARGAGAQQPSDAPAAAGSPAKQ